MRDIRHWPVLAMLATCATWSGPTLAQAGLTDLLRGVSGALRGQQQPQQQQGLTPTIGVRGMEDGDTASAGPATAEYAQVETWAVTPDGAQKAAAKRKLSARPVTLRADGAAPTLQDKGAAQ